MAQELYDQDRPFIAKTVQHVADRAIPMRAIFHKTFFHVITLIISNANLQVTGCQASKPLVGIKLLISFGSPKESKKLIVCKLIQKNYYQNIGHEEGMKQAAVPEHDIDLHTSVAESISAGELDVTADALEKILQ